MPFIPVPNALRVVMKWQKAGQQLANVFHVKYDTAPDEDALNAVGSIFKDAWVATLKGMMSTDTTLNAVEVTDISAPGGLGIVYLTGLPQSGTSAGIANPNHVTVATKLLTGRTGRSYRGRSYMVGIPSEQLQADRQTIKPELQTALTNFFAQLVAELLLQSMNLGVASLYSGVDADHKPIPRPTGIITEVLSTVTNNVIDSQRRRLPERGS